MKQKTILITGASRGIGLATTQKLLLEGWTVIGIARQFSSFSHPQFIPYSIDLENLKTLPSILSKLTKMHPEIDAILCNAAKGIFGNLEELSFQDISSLLALNFLSHTYLIKAFLPSLKKKNLSHIIFMGSEAGLQGKKQGTIYCSSKFALRGFAQALREECTASNVRISLINPGMVKTDFFHQLHFSPGDHPLEHILPEDVAAAVHFLLQMREGTVIDEINLSPQKKKILFTSNRPVI